MSKAIIATVVGAVAVCFILPAVVISAVFPGGGPGCMPTTTITATSTGQPERPWDPEQISIAKTITDVGISKGVPHWGLVIALATAMQESGLRNLPHLGSRNDHDSIGVFQQRPSQGWGTPEQLASPEYQAERFFDKLLKVPRWQELPLTQAAQAVQQSAYPDAYQKWAQDALQLTALTTMDASNAGCDVVVGPAGWAQPVRAKIVSGFGQRDGRLHAGVDLSVAKGTPVHAAASGIVRQAACNAHINDTPYSCDIDGSRSVSGCGWYVDIEHADRVITRYCHMITRPRVHIGEQVAAGQLIGLSGSSGHSDGPHVHFEVHLNADSTPSGAIDPVPFMDARGAPLGTAMGTRFH